MTVDIRWLKLVYYTLKKIRTRDSYFQSFDNQNCTYLLSNVGGKKT